MKKKKIENVERSLSPEEIAFQSAEEVWQEEFEAEIRFKEELLYEGALIERKRMMDSLRKFLMQEENAPVKPISLELIKDPSLAEKFKIEHIDVNALVNDLEKRLFFESKYRSKVISWFNGLIPLYPIPIMVSADVFVSLIADMMDTKQRLIMNTKEFVSFYIARSFRFKGKKCENKSIYQIMKPGTHKNRISYLSEKIPNIQDFIKNTTT
jgi:hypothetical protein